jgi:2-keto-3-deoxy-L-fuconate dehydrogenase
MGPPIAELFADEGAEVIADTDPLTDAQAPRALVDRAGDIDVLVAARPANRFVAGSSARPP